MRKGIIITVALSLAFLVGCKKTNNSNNESENGKTSYTVTKEQYDETCYYAKNVSKMTSLNYKVTYDKTVNDQTYHYYTKIDNGKLLSHSSDYEFYLDFKKGTYNADNQTWSFDGYWQDGGVMIKESYENQRIPDDIFLPDVGFLASYDELTYNSEKNYYELNVQSKTLNDYYVYSDLKVKFENGKITYISYKEEVTYSGGKTYYHVFEITDYGKTVVDLPSMIGPA